MKPNDKLRAYWSKPERDVMLYHPLGAETRRDAAYLSELFGKDFQREMESRGYDMTTMRFSICPANGNQKFASQRPGSSGISGENDGRP